ncbi:hypothetical protein JW998_04205 [candidate division KSB1 bacterium]|nr:hypothetical protein [candidate division KSB1 bacterium]
MKKLMSLLLIAALVMSMRCSKSDDNNPIGPGPAGDAPTLVTHKITIPQKMKESTDPHAMLLVSYMSLANTFSASLNSSFAPPSLAKPIIASGEGPWEYSWKDGGKDIRVIITALTDAYQWQLFYTSNDGTSEYNNWMAMKAVQHKNERSGSYYSYVSNTAVVLVQFDWYLDENDNLHFEVRSPQNPFVRGNKFIGVVNTDMSGELDVYISADADALIEAYKWDAVGAGEWWTYDDNQLVDSGSWQ